MDLVTFNALPLRSAVAELTACCSAPDWAQQVASRRPFGTAGELIRCADEVLTGLDDDSLDAALAGHPRIGAQPPHPSSRREQAGLTTAGAGLREELAKINRIRLARLVDA